MSVDDLDEVKGFTPSDLNMEGLGESFKKIGFQATNLGRAYELIKRMRDEDAFIILTFTSNMVSSGLRELFAWTIKNDYVDLIITSVGSIEEDVMKTQKPFLLGDFNVSDTELKEKGINRIGNVFVPNDRYESLEDIVQPFLDKMYEKQKQLDRLLSPSEIIHELGKELSDDDSILYWATRNEKTVLCPAITDGAFGLQTYFYKQKQPGFGIDVTADMKKAADLILNADKVGAIILGGGAPKHHAIGLNILRDGLDYAVYVTTATPSDGSLSGARPKEAKSWSKIKENADNVCVEADATLVAPILFNAFQEKE